MHVSAAFINDCLDEGITIDVVSKTISFYSNSEFVKRKNSFFKPHLVYSERSFGKVFSLFKRESLQDSSAESCFVQAIKNENGWRFKNNTDHNELIRRIIRSSRVLSSDFDTLITIKSEDQFNNSIFECVRSVTKYQHFINDTFYKITASEVYDREYDYDFLKSYLKDDFRLWLIDQHISRNLFEMMRGNNVFTYKKTDPVSREYLEISLRILNSLDLKAREEINDRKVLVLDDTVSSGKTLSDYAFALNATFCPTSITFLTVFSPQGDAGTDIYNDSIEVLPYQDL